MISVGQGGWQGDPGIGQTWNSEVLLVAFIYRIISAAPKRLPEDCMGFTINITIVSPRFAQARMMLYPECMPTVVGGGSDIFYLTSKLLGGFWRVEVARNPATS